MAVLDLQKAFDVVDRDILSSKLKVFGFNNAAVRWIRSYLTDRKQVVDVGGTTVGLISGSVDCGLPQGIHTLHVNRLL